MPSKNYKELEHNEYLDYSFEELLGVKETAGKDNESSEDIGQVSGCKRLNIRKEPNKDAEVIAIVDCGDFLVIDFSTSNDEWYGVCTVAGITGYCMKEFVSV